MSSRRLNSCGDVDRFLAGHRVGDQQDLGRADLALQLFQLLHHGVVDLQAAGGVDEDRILALVARVLAAHCCTILSGFSSAPSL